MFLEPLEVRLPLHSEAVIAEVMFQPLPASDVETLIVPTATSDDFEYVELWNPSVLESLSLAELELEGDIQFQFPDVQLAAGEFAVVVANTDAFVARYGESIRVLGQWQGTLPDEALHVSLVDGDGHTAVDLRVADGSLWPSRARGIGSSLELTQPDTTSVHQMSKPSPWQASFEFHGTPGAAPGISKGILINEVVGGYSSSGAVGDRVELVNVSDEAIDIGGWYLGNTTDDPQKYQLREGTSLEPGEFLALGASDFTPTPSDPDPGEMTLDWLHGDALFLTSAVDADLIGRFEDSIEVGPGENVSWGRDPVRHEIIAPLLQASLGLENAPTVSGPALVGEVNYHPPDPSFAASQIDPTISADDLEYFEIYNRTDQELDVSGWSIAGSVAFSFADGTRLSPNQALVAVSFDPHDSELTSRLLAFRTHYGIDATVQFVGPYEGILPDEYGQIMLHEPGRSPETEPDFIPRYLRDEARYDDDSPWPASADGAGSSLDRSDLNGSGQSPDAWIARSPSPGRVSKVARPDAQLPDLAFWDDPLLGMNYFDYLDVHPSTGRRIMRFSTAVTNVGDGPLIVKAGESVGNEQQVVQTVKNRDESTTDFTAGHYVFHPTHGHVHFANYALYTLYEVGDDGGLGAQVAGGDKISFCLLDSAPVHLDLPGAPVFPVYASCEQQTQGISAGWADVYASDLDDQWIDIDDLEAGEYWFETKVDPYDNLLETDDSNNAIRHKIILGVPEYDPDPLDAADIKEQRLGTGDQQLTQLSIHRPGDVDTFRWVAPVDGSLQVDLSFDRSQGDIDLYVWGTDAQGQFDLVSQVTDGSGEHGSIQVLAGNSYFIVVKDLSGDTNPSYNLTIDGPDIHPDGFESNNSVLEPVDLGSANHALRNLSIHDSQDQDFFAWTAPETAVLLIDLGFNAVQGQLNLYVHDFATSRVVSSESGTGRRLLEVDVEQGGTYVIVVRGQDGDMQSSYDLSLELLDIPIDPFEPNDSRAAPANLGSGDQARTGLTVHTTFNRDFYRWQAPDNGIAVVDLLFANTLGDLDLILWSDDRIVTTSNSRSDNEQLTFLADSGHSYILEVRGRNGATHPEYSLLIDGPDAVPDRLEPNDTLAEGTMLPVGDVVLDDLNIHESHASDFFNWTPVANGVVLVDLLFEHSRGDLDLALWSGGTVVEASTSVDDNERLFVYVEADRTYSLEVYGKDADINPDYELRIDGPELAPDSFEPNDTLGSAVDIGSGDLVLAGVNVHETHNADFYRWTPTSVGRASIDLVFHHEDGDLDLALWADGTVTRLASSSDDNEVIRVDVDPEQEYVVEVRGKDGAVNPSYELQIDSPESPLDDYEANNDLGHAFDLGSDDVDLTSLTIHDETDSDFFRWTSLARGTVVVDLRFVHSEGDVDLALWIDDEVVATSEGTEDDEQIVVEVEPNETIVVEVVGKNGDTNYDYGLRIDGPNGPQVTSIQVAKASATDVWQTLVSEGGRMPSVPWVDWRRVRFEFSRDVIVQPQDLIVENRSGLGVEVGGFRYDALTHVATWTFMTTPGAGELTLMLRDTVTDIDENPLDGNVFDWRIPSGDGRPGGSFRMAVDVRPGDFNRDGVLNHVDIDQLAAAIRRDDVLFDLDADGATTAADTVVMVQGLMGTAIGDANLDGVFDSTDFVVTFAAAEFEDDTEGISTWSTGDFNGDGNFDSSDLVFALQMGGYTA